MSFNKKIKLVKQLDTMDCGPACLKMISTYYNLPLSIDKARKLCDKGQQGVSLLGIMKAAEELGFKTLPAKVSVETLITHVSSPCVLHWGGDHFVVLHEVKKDKIGIADPKGAIVHFDLEEFKRFWCSDGDNGVALFIEPTEQQFENERRVEEDESQPNSFVKLFRYFFRYDVLMRQLIIGTLVVSILNLFFPFLTQTLVDSGVGSADINIVYAVVISQVVLFFSKTFAEFLRGWVLIHLSTRVNVAILSDYLLKMMKLPISFFSRRNLGDILQRVSDHERIEEFLSSQAINLLFSFVNLIIFSSILLFYSVEVFITFVVGSFAAVGWITLFLNRRRVLDYSRFKLMADNQNAMVQIVSGMEEIKLNQCQLQKRWQWQRLQTKLFKVRLKGLAIEQYQQAGNIFFNEGKNILITFITAQQVIEGNMSLGMMMAITYILGQVNAPISQFIEFIRLGQDAKIGMERLEEVHHMKTEEEMYSSQLANSFSLGDIKLENLDFYYSIHDEKPALNNVSLTIPHQKTVAIVGASGSGKTTLMKVLLKFFSEYKGSISLNDVDFKLIAPDAWRENCGAVMQDGFIFDDSILSNICLNQENVDMERLFYATKVANIHNEIEALPQGYDTKIGQEGVQLSGGQKQRVLIARAVYKNPKYLLFDEATSALDANNEKVIQENLETFFEGKTVVIIAHRLSTVKHADQIIVLDKGSVVEVGDHQSLTQTKGYYYQLIKNQLELGS